MKRTNEQFVSSDGISFYLRCLVPFHVKERNTPTVLLHPAGTCMPDDYSWITNMLCRRGFLVYTLFQRGYGSGPPEENDRGGLQQQQDLREAFQFVKQQPLVDPERIVCIGHSNGAHMIQRLAVLEDFACGVAMSQLSDWNTHCRVSKEFIPDYYYNRALKWYNGSPEENPEEYLSRSCLHLADQIKMPILAITGDRDNITPPHWGRLMTEALQRAGNTRSEFISVHKAGHFFENFGFYGDQRAEVAEIVADWLDKILPQTERK